MKYGTAVQIVAGAAEEDESDFTLRGRRSHEGEPAVVSPVTPGEEVREGRHSRGRGVCEAAAGQHT